MQVKQLLFVLIIFLIYPPSSSSQVIDSLINLLNKTETAHQKVDLWVEISSEQQPIGGKKAAENALKLAKQIHYTKGEADANYYLSRYYYLKDNQRLAKVHIEKAITLYDSKGFQSDKAESLVFLGEILYFDQKYSVALEHLQEAEAIALQIKKDKILALSYENQALIYLEGLEDEESGKDYIIKSHILLSKINTPNLLIQSHINLATFYIETGNINSALLYIKKGEIILNDPNNKKSNINIYLQNSLIALKGTYYTKIGKLDTAKLFIEQTIPFFKANENWYDVAWSYSDLSEIALKENNYEEAIFYAKKSLDLDITDYFLEENIKLIRDGYKHLNQDSFHLYNEKFITLLNDTEDIVHANEIQEVLKEKELHQKEKELVKEKNSSKYIIISILLLSVAYGLSLFFYYKNPKRKKANSNSKQTNKPDLVSPNDEIEIDLLRQKVHTIERSLLSKEIDLERQRSSLDNTTQHLKEIVAKDNPAELKRSIQKLSNQLEHNQNSKDQWASFSQQFERIHPNFFHRLREHSPNLSTREKRLCAYGKLGMTNQEVAQILGIATGSVGKARHRLKKKMNLDKEQDLNQFLSSL